MDCQPYDEQKLAYAAGYFDAEGSISVLRSGKHLQIRIAMETGDLDSQRVFEELFGVAPYLRNNRSKTGLPLFRWALNAKAAVDALNAILPFMRAKKAQAELVLGSGWDFSEARGRRASNAEKEKREMLKAALECARSAMRNPHAARSPGAPGPSHFGTGEHHEPLPAHPPASRGSDRT
jgi:hypothetical protein